MHKFKVAQIPPSRAVKRNFKHSKLEPHTVPEAIVEAILCRDDPDILSSLDPDAVGRQEIVNFVQTLPELGDPLVDVVHQT